MENNDLSLFKIYVISPNHQNRSAIADYLHKFGIKSVYFYEPVNVKQVSKDMLGKMVTPKFLNNASTNQLTKTLTFYSILHEVTRNYEKQVMILSEDTLPTDTLFLQFPGIYMRLPQDYDMVLLGDKNKTGQLMLLSHQGAANIIFYGTPFNQTLDNVIQSLVEKGQLNLQSGDSQLTSISSQKSINKSKNIESFKSNVRTNLTMYLTILAVLIIFIMFMCLS